MKNHFHPALLFLLSILFVGSGCETVGRRSGPGPVVHHVVVIWLKNPGDAAGRQRVIERTHSLRNLPGIRRISAGTMLPSPRSQVDSSYDVAVVFTFENEQALRAYEKDPAHKAAVKDTLLPLAQRFKIYDFVDQE